MIERMPERLCRGSAEWKLVVGLCTSSASMCVDAARNSA